jgi:hypothetical protein
MKFGGCELWPTPQRAQTVTFRGDVLFCRIALATQRVRGPVAQAGHERRRSLPV